MNSFKVMEKNPSEKDCLEMLRLLIEVGTLDLFVAVRTGGIYHRKIGLFTDIFSNKVLFTGSGNETPLGIGSIEDWSNDEDFDFKGLARHLKQALPSYAVPKFIRFSMEFESTATHKLKKIDSKKEGFDPDKVSDPIYVLLPGDSEYKPLTKKLYEEIMSEKYRF